jgi:hypothetical protein
LKEEQGQETGDPNAERLTRQFQVISTNDNGRYGAANEASLLRGSSTTIAKGLLVFRDFGKRSWKEK